MSSLAFDNNPEDNPFADPFARPRSPDPWNSFRAPEPEPEAEESEESDKHEVARSVPESKSEPPSPTQPPLPQSEDPLESQILREPSPPPPPGRRAPFAAYREPTPPPTESTKDGDKTPKRSSIPAQSSPATPPESPKAPEPKPASPPPQRAVTPPPAVIPDHPKQEAQQEPATSQIQNPLDSPIPRTTYAGGWVASEQNQFASLSLGGEMPGPNWKPPESNLEESTFVNDGLKEEDDTGDDEPLANQVSAKRLSVPIPPVFDIAVEDPQKVGDPVRGYTMYTVHTKTTSPLFSKSSFSVLRRFSDFLWLYDTLSASNPGVVVPPVPEKNPFGRFQDTFIEQRRLGLQQCIQKIANHPVLQKDADLRFFLESDNFALEIKHRSAAGGGAGGLMASIGSSIVGAKFFEADEWFDQKKIYFDSLESQLKGLVKAIDIVTKSRQEVSAALSEFSETAAELSSADLSKTMVVGLATLADVERKSKELQEIQARQETVLLINTVDEYIRLISSVRLAFASRVRIHATWQAADNDVRRLKANQDRARRQGKLPSDRIAQSLAEVQEVERRAMETKREFDHVSRLIKSEVSRFEKERVEDFKKSLESLLNGMIARQREVIHAWEHYQEMLLRKPSQQHQQHNPPEPQEASPINYGVEESDTNPFA